MAPRGFAVDRDRLHPVDDAVAEFRLSSPHLAVDRLAAEVAEAVQRVLAR